VYRHHFYSDYIYLSHHSGIHIFGSYIAVTSIQHQCVQVFIIKESGEFLHAYTIGAYLYSDDRCLFYEESEPDNYIVSRLNTLFFFFIQFNSNPFTFYCRICKQWDLSRGCWLFCIENAKRWKTFAYFMLDLR
jgi:hypothetical protein